MAEPESDGIAEVFDDGMRLAITAAGRVAERRIRQREQEMREAQATSEQTARELQARIDAERAHGARPAAGDPQSRLVGSRERGRRRERVGGGPGVA